MAEKPKNRPKSASAEELLKTRDKYLMPALITYFSKPVTVVKAEMQYVYDETGKKYLDAFSAVVTISVGHCHPNIVPEVQKQMGKLQHITSLYLSEPMIKYAEKLASIAPGSFFWSTMPLSEPPSLKILTGETIVLIWIPSSMAASISSAKAGMSSCALR